jgi:hypothetical protein
LGPAINNADIADEAVGPRAGAGRDHREEHMAVDHSAHVAHVKKYAPHADDKIINAIIKHLGIALRSKDASYVACSDADELKRVRESWCKKKLGLSGDADIDASIKKVCETMKSDRDKSRVAFYYLVAEHYKKLGALA